MHACLYICATVRIRKRECVITQVDVCERENQEGLLYILLS